MLHRLYEAGAWVYDKWGTMSSLVLGILAFIIALRPKKVAELEDGALWAIGLPFLIGVIAVSGYLRSTQDDANFRQQISTLYTRVSLEASKDDLQSLISHIDTGFNNVIDEIQKLCKSQAIPQPKLEVKQPLPAPPHVTFSQARTLPSDPQYKFGLQVTLQSDQSVPVSFLIDCTGKINKVDAFLVGQSAYLSVMRGVLPDAPETAIIRFGYPPLTPETPLIVTLSSNDDIRVKEVRPYKQ